MKTSTKLRILGGVIILFNLTFAGYYTIEGIPLLMMSFGFAIGYEYLIVRPLIKNESINKELDSEKYNFNKKGNAQISLAILLILFFSYRYIYIKTR